MTSPVINTLNKDKDWNQGKRRAGPNDSSTALPGTRAGLAGKESKSRRHSDVSLLSLHYCLTFSSTQQCYLNRFGGSPTMLKVCNSVNFFPRLAHSSAGVSSH